MTPLNRRLGAAALAVACLATPGAAQDSMLSTPGSGDATPTIEEYQANAGAVLPVVPHGQYKIDGSKMTCGKRPTILDDNLDDYGAAYPGFLIMNPKLLEKLTPAVKKWIFAHECGHQFRGPDEATADCFAVQRGRRYGWLDEKGLDEVCEFMSPAKGDNMHFSGPQRCEHMRKCFADPTVR